MENQDQLALAPSAAGTIRVQRAKRWLPVQLTEKELLHLSETACKAIILADDLENERKEQQAEYKERIKDLEAEIKLLTRKINRGEEDREIEVETWYDHPEPGIKTTIRLDTGAILNAEPMKQDEKQMEIPLPVIDAQEDEETEEYEEDEV